MYRHFLFMYKHGHFIQAPNGFYKHGFFPDCKICCENWLFPIAKIFVCDSVPHILMSIFRPGNFPAIVGASFTRLAYHLVA